MGYDKTKLLCCSMPLSVYTFYTCMLSAVAHKGWSGGERETREREREREREKVGGEVKRKRDHIRATKAHSRIYKLTNTNEGFQSVSDHGQAQTISHNHTSLSQTYCALFLCEWSFSLSVDPIPSTTVFTWLPSCTVSHFPYVQLRCLFYSHSSSACAVHIHDWVHFSIF